MADKATLLQKVPPIAKKTSSSNPTRAEDTAGTSAGTEVQPAGDVSISSFQAVTYGSFVLTFVLAGFAAVVLFRKALDTTEQRFSKSAKALAGVFALMSLHGFFVTANYTNYLRDETHSAPLSLTLLIWIILGAAISFTTNRLLEFKEKLKVAEVVIDTFFYAGIFVCLTLAVSSEVSTNTALILSLLALILCTVPLARFFVAYKAVKFRQPVLQLKPIKRLLYSLVIIPALLPLFAIFYVFKLFGPDTTLLCLTLTASSFVLFVSFSMLGSIKALKVEQASEADTAAPQNDPLVEELLAEEAAAKSDAETQQIAEPDHKIKPVTAIAPNKPKRPGMPKPPPKQQTNPTDKAPTKPGAPKKPGQANKDSNKPASNSPAKVKAPAKPKKRF